MRKKYNIRIPKGKEVKNVKTNIVNGNIKVSFDLDDVFEPKDGDLCVTDNGCIFICNTSYTIGDIFGFYVGISAYNEIVFNKDDKTRFSCAKRLATKQEKSAFFERLKNECGKRWNEEKKCLENVYVPKFGDIVKVIVVPKWKRDYMICIYPKREEPWDGSYIRGFFNIANLNLNGHLSFECGNKNDGNLHIIPASESEKQELFDKLREAGKRWNEETKKLEDIRWKPKEGDTYFYINNCGEISKTIYNTVIDSYIVGIGNAFKTEEAAKPYADKMKDIFKNSKAE